MILDFDDELEYEVVTKDGESVYFDNKDDAREFFDNKENDALVFNRVATETLDVKE